jgi:hypothetical protein
MQDDNVTLRTFHPEGPNVQPEQRTDIMPHHEVLLRLDAMDLERGALGFIRHAHTHIHSLTLLSRSFRRQDRRPQRILPHQRRHRPQPSAHLVRARLFAETRVQEDPAAVHDEQGRDGEDGAVGSV